ALDRALRRRRRARSRSDRDHRDAGGEPETQHPSLGQPRHGDVPLSRSLGAKPSFLGRPALREATSADHKTTRAAERGARRLVLLRTEAQPTASFLIAPNAALSATAR